MKVKAILRLEESRLNGRVQLPLSKSVLNRVLVINAFAGKSGWVSEEALPEDSKIMQRELASQEQRIEAEDAGTVYRFLTAVLTMRQGTWFLTGSDRMKERTIAPLVDALRSLGADITYLEEEGFPPVVIKGGKLKGGEVHVAADSSSQFISALMLIGPLIEGGLDINLVGNRVSFEYILMTAGLIKMAGIDVIIKGNSISVPQGLYRPLTYFERDWSSAAFIYLLASLAEESDVLIEYLKTRGLQGDERTHTLFLHWGVQSEPLANGIKIKNGHVQHKLDSIDLSDHPDLFPVVAVSAAARRSTLLISGIDHVRFKESDRIACLAKELSKVGTSLDKIADNTYRIRSSGELPDAVQFETYNDHRIAMALSAFVTRIPQVELEDPGVIRKSFPNYWDQLRRLGISVELV